MAAACWLYTRRAAHVFFEYDTPKIVHIRSKRYGVINRVLQLGILGYVIGYVIVYNKGYQKFDNGAASVTTKVKGVQYTNLSSIYPEVGSRIWDIADIVVPSQENSAFFVTTNVIVTRNQTQGKCPEDVSVVAGRCKNDSDCPPGKPLLLGNGMCTGRCVAATGTCEVYAWCPVERDTPPLNYSILNGTAEFTVLLKNHVYFPYFKLHRSNIPPNANKSYLQNCIFNNVTDLHCPVFRLKDVVSMTGSSFDDLAYTGGVVMVQLDWNCNFDFAANECLPTYSFLRLDTQDSDSQLAQGYNFRYAQNYDEAGIPKRTVMKAYGILFLISVTSKAGAFNVVPLFLNVGSGLALLAVATVVCDILVLYCNSKRTFFRERKYEQVKADDAYDEVYLG